jgi:hypothetical protein
LAERAPDPQIVKRMEEVKALSDDEVVALMWGMSGIESGVLPHEMTRRQLIVSRELTQAMRDADRSARRAAKWLIIFTIALVVLSLALLVTAVVPLWSEIAKLASGAWGWAASDLP